MTRWRRVAWSLFFTSVISLPAQADRFGGQIPVQYAPDRTLDVEHVRLDVHVDPDEGAVRGSVTITGTTLRSVAEVVLHAGPMTISSITYEGIKTGWRHKKQRLLISVPRTKRGRRVTLKVEYSAEPKRGMYFVAQDPAYPSRSAQAWTQGEAQDNRFWFPNWDFPNDRFTTEMVVTVPVSTQR